MARRMQKNGFAALLDQISATAQAQTVFAIDAIDKQLLLKRALFAKQREAHQASRSHRGLEPAGICGILWQVDARTLVDIVRHKNTEAISAGAIRESLQHGIDETGRGGTVLIEENKPLKTLVASPADTGVQSGGDAKVFAILDEFKADPEPCIS